MKKAKVSPETESTEQAVVENPAEEKTKAEKPKKQVNKVGALLKEMRLQKGLRLPDIAKRLCIRRLYLEAIEESDYKELPPFPYGVGFIRSYADYLGLNSSNIVELYKEETNTNPDKNIYVLEPQSEATVPNRKYLVISLLALILVYVLWYFYNNQALQEATEPKKVETQEVIADSDAALEAMPIVVEDYTVAPEVPEVEGEALLTSTPEEETAEPEVKKEEPPATEAPASEVVNEQVTITEASFVEPEKENANAPLAAEEPKKDETVVIKIKEETWIEVKNADTLYISKVLHEGDEYVVPEGGKGMILSVGKVEGADVYINGKLTKVAKPNKKTNIALDPFLAEAH